MEVLADRFMLDGECSLRKDQTAPLALVSARKVGAWNSKL
jgi:hypothetical protein